MSPPHLQFDHPAVQHAPVGRGGAVGVHHVAGVRHPVVQVPQALEEELVLAHDVLHARRLLLENAGRRTALISMG